MTQVQNQKGSDNMIRFFTFYVAAFFMLTSPSFAKDVTVFNGKDLNGWKEKTFEGHSTYMVEKEGLSASCNAGASSMYREIEINLDETPILNWSWRVSQDSQLGNQNERQKSGDDFAARIYAVVNTGTIIPKVLSLNYVWAQNEAIGNDWPNPFYTKARMVVLESANDAGAWKTESRNLKKDFQTYFGTDIKAIDGIAIMTDCDNAKGKASAQYGAITVSSE